MVILFGHWLVYKARYDPYESMNIGWTQAQAFLLLIHELLALYHVANSWKVMSNVLKIISVLWVASAWILVSLSVWKALHTRAVSDGPSMACAMHRHNSYVVQRVRSAAGQQEGKYPLNPSNQTSSSLALIVTHDPTDDTWWPYFSWKEGVNDMISKQK